MFLFFYLRLRGLKDLDNFSIISGINIQKENKQYCVRIQSDRARKNLHFHILNKTERFLFTK